MLSNSGKLPKTKEGQNTAIGTEFLKFFTENEKNRILEILKSGTYIPQEIVSVLDFSETVY